MRSAIWLSAWVSILCASPAASQPNLRLLEVPTTASWQHAQTGLILPSRLAGLGRQSLHDSGAEELDVMAQYRADDGSFVATIYVFRPQIASVPLWFDRAKTVLEQLPAYKIGSNSAGQVAPFTPAGGAAGSGLRVAFPLNVLGLTSTALAVAPVNDWIVKVRLSSRSLTPAQLEPKLGDLLSAIRWPAIKGTSPAAIPVEPCLKPLVHKRAKMLKPDTGLTLIGSLMAMTVAMKKPGDKLAAYCREPQQRVEYGVYRPQGSADGYLVAIGDSGRAVQVGPGPSADLKKTVYSVTLLDLGRSSVFPSFDRRPSLEQVMQTVGSTRPVSSNRLGTTTVEVGVPQGR